MKCSIVRPGALIALLVLSSGTSCCAAEWGTLEGLIVAPHSVTGAPSLLAPDLQQTMMTMFPANQDAWSDRATETSTVPHPRDDSVNTRERSAAESREGVAARPASRRSFGQGLAAWYKHHGRTASGEIFNPGSLTAAHGTLPFGTRLRVVNLRNGRSAVVRINDRISRKAKSRLNPALELSQAGAKALGFEGLARVAMYVADEDRGR